jgi:hypothetical protein
VQKSSFYFKLATLILGTLIALCSVQSCGTKDALLPDEAYFPLRVGSVWIYDVTESHIIRADCADDGVTNAGYELKVEVTNSYSNMENGTTYLFQRSRRNNATDPWMPFESWTAQVSGTKLIANQNNINYVKMSYPIASARSWNGNEYNTEKQLNGLNPDTYSFSQVHAPNTISSGLKFDRTVTVIQNAEESNILYRDSRKEIYAYGVGLVYKESVELSYFSNSQVSCFGQKRTKQGTTYKQVLKEFTK